VRYRWLTLHYTSMHPPSPTLSDFWASELLETLTPVHWRPAADTWETPASVEIAVELAGVDEDALEVQLFEDLVVVVGDRPLPGGAAEAYYHSARIRRGPFRVEIPLPAIVDPERIEARFERGILRITLPKRNGGT
jgi:HSP20 family protein